MSTSLKRDIEDMLEELEARPPPEQDRSPCIYRVPKSLRKINDAAYTPQAISIGPLHHGKGDLHKMETHKLKYVSYFLAGNNQILGQLVSTVGERETRIRSYYAGPLELDSNKLLKIILVDAIFIIEYFRVHYFQIFPDDYVLRIPRLVEDIHWDLLLLENQLPFPLLEELYDLVFPPNEHVSFLAIASAFFSHHNKQNKSITMPHDIKHLTDLIRFFYLRPDPVMPNISQNHVPPRPPAEGKYFFLLRWFKEPEKDYKTDIVPSATELHQAGVKLKMKTGNCRLDINYKEGVLEIPCLELDDTTEIIFRNMMAFEQCYYPSKDWIICEYVGLLDDLINTNKDVDLLVENEIIHNRMGSTEAVTQLFNKLCTNILIGGGYYSTVQEGLIRYYMVPWHKLKATFIHNYFRTPWSTASTIAAFILLFLTLVQTVCSILSVTAVKN